jgi:hypothetical protein
MAALTREGLPMGAADVPGVDWISPARRLTPELVRVMSGGYVRGADAWHLACALFLDRTRTNWCSSPSTGGNVTSRSRSDSPLREGPSQAFS